MNPTIPSLPHRPKQFFEYDQTRIDNYFFLRDLSDPETLPHLQRENEYLEQVMAPLQPLQEQILDELKARIKEDDSTAPERYGPHEYYQRMEPGREYPIYCRRPVGGGEEQVLLDQNELAQGHSYCALGAFQISPDHTKLAYAVDFNGSETYTLRILDLETGEHYPEVIPNTISYMFNRSGVAWAATSRHLFYATFDDTHRPDKIYRHTLGAAPSEDVLVYHEPDLRFPIYMQATRSGEYISLFMFSHGGTEVRVIPAAQPESEPVLIMPRKKGVEYRLEHHEDRFLIWIDEGAPDFKVVSAPVSDPSPANWVEVIPHRPGILVEEVHAFQGYLVLLERTEGRKQVRVSHPDGWTDARYVAFPEPVYDVNIAPNPEFQTQQLRLIYSSLVTPKSVVDYDMKTGEWVVVKQDEVPGYDPSLYTMERLFATASDGSRIPISLVYRKGIPRDGQNPLMLYGYGSYGSSTDPVFVANRFSLIDRGVVWALAHVRGGSEMGRAWYEQGRLLHKMNSFTDFIACAEHLFKEGYTQPRRLAIMGRSAGGLLVGAVLVLRPDLCRAVVGQVAFVDVISTMSDPTIPLTVMEYTQWGNPTDRELYDAMLAYSPYDNLRPGEYPDVLLTTGLNDPRVAFWEPAKFILKLRDLNTNDSLALLKTAFDSGHGGASGRYSALKEVALIYTFVLDRLGVLT